MELDTTIRRLENNGFHAEPIDVGTVNRFRRGVKAWRGEEERPGYCVKSGILNEKHTLPRPAERDAIIYPGNRERLIDLLTISICTAAEGEYMRKKAGELEQSLLLKDSSGERSVCRITPKFLEKYGIREEEAWKRAFGNLREETGVETVACLLTEWLGPEYDYYAPKDATIPLYIITAKNDLLAGRKYNDFVKRAKRRSDESYLVAAYDMTSVIVIPLE